MDRRSALKYLGVASAAAMILPSCAPDAKKVSIALNNLNISGDQETLLAEFADTLIPATDTPGAKAVGAHHFALIMIDDCHSKDEQDQYLTGLRSFPDKLNSISGKSFMKSSPEERLAMLTEVEKDPSKLTEEEKKFYSMSRNYILKGYLQSKHFLTTVKEYQLIPGPVFHGCIPVSQA